MPQQAATVISKQRALIVLPDRILEKLNDPRTRDGQHCAGCLQAMLLIKSYGEDLYIKIKKTHEEYRFAALCTTCVNFYGNNNRENLVAFLENNGWHECNPSPPPQTPQKSISISIVHEPYWSNSFGFILSSGEDIILSGQWKIKPINSAQINQCCKCSEPAAHEIYPQFDRILVKVLKLDEIWVTWTWKTFEKDSEVYVRAMKELQEKTTPRKEIHPLCEKHYFQLYRYMDDDHDHLDF